MVEYGIIKTEKISLQQDVIICPCWIEMSKHGEGKICWHI